MVSAKTYRRLGIQLAIGKHRDIAHLRQSPNAIIPHPAPGRHSRKLTFLQHAAAPVLRLLGNRDLKALSGGDQRGLKSCRPSAYYQHAVRRRCLSEPLRMPAAPPFLARCRVLGTADRHTVVPARDTNIAADTFADIVTVALADF